MAVVPESRGHFAKPFPPFLSVSPSYAPPFHSLPTPVPQRWGPIPQKPSEFNLGDKTILEAVVSPCFTHPLILGKNWTRFQGKCLWMGLPIERGKGNLGPHWQGRKCQGHQCLHHIRGTWREEQALSLHLSRGFLVGVLAG